LRNRLNPLEVGQHAAFVATLGSSPIWRDYVSETDGE
jgi:DNA polymerase-3 subunit epsilon